LWRTPNADEATGRGEYKDLEKIKERWKKHQVLLCQQVKMWPTPQAHDATGPRGPGNELADHHYYPHDLASAARMYPTPLPSDVDGGRTTKGKKRQNETGLRLAAMWRTPSSTVIEPKSSVVKLDGRTPDDPQVGLADQVGGQLNPNWVEWLMGYPIGWTDCEPSATP
jgi:hypothetical protein